MSKKALIIGAGPAGLTAAYELQKHTDIQPVVLEMSGDIGGISKTVNYKGNRIDIGGHRFFSKSDRVMEWWREIMPLQGSPSKDEVLLNISYQNKSRQIELDANGPDPEKEEKVMLIRNRLSRIFYMRKFFSYPVTMSIETVLNLGIFRIAMIVLSYLKVKIAPIKTEKSLEDFFINRFGKKLYKTFFKDYTEKVWGVPCTEIEPEWGAQRIKGLSITKTVIHAIKSIIRKDNTLDQKGTETSLIEHFIYPKHGPGQMWETVADIVKQKGGKVIQFQKAEQLIIDDSGNIKQVIAIDKQNNKTTYDCDYVLSTMPVKELFQAFNINVPKEVVDVANGLVYRDFITVGLLLDKLLVKNKTSQKTVNDLIPDNWIYIQEHDVKVARLQIFNNWSPYMVDDLNNVWLGLEYLCSEGDDIWSRTDDKLKELAIIELTKLNIIDASDVLDSTVIRMPKTYPAYFGTYNKFDTIKEFVNTIPNLFLIGRNGMHKYNNQDHSMLTAMIAVENIKNNITTKDNIWEVNTEEEYHETK